MKEDDLTSGNEEASLNLATYDPEHKSFQTLYLCEYLRELPEIIEDGKASAGKKGTE